MCHNGKDSRDSIYTEELKEEAVKIPVQNIKGSKHHQRHCYILPDSYGALYIIIKKKWSVLCD